MDDAMDDGTDGPGEPEARRKREKRAPRRITQAHLENVALWYLGRFAASAHMLHDVLMRRVARAARHHGTDPEDGAELVRALIARYREVGLLDDRTYAEGRARTLHARGLPLRAIRLRLRQKGVGADDIDAALAALAEEARRDAEALGGEEAETPSLDLIAARRHAQKRRLGPWRRGPAREGQRGRDLAALDAGETDTAPDPAWPDPEFGDC